MRRAVEGRRRGRHWNLAGLFVALVTSACWPEPLRHDPNFCDDLDRKADEEGGLGCDLDMDGIPHREDCDDTDPDLPARFYPDTDDDGAGAPDSVITACSRPVGYVTNADDCDDTDGSSHPGALESCGDEADNDCDGLIDEPDEGAGATEWYLDQDGDGYGRAQEPVTACSAPAGYVDNRDDCRDDDPAIHPDAPELCDDIDQNCNVDPKDVDADRDGHVDDACGGDDCDDLDGSVHPGALEVCNNADSEDCDSERDDRDADLDGSIEAACGGDDCDDTAADVNPQEPEVMDQRDNNCDGRIDEGDGCDEPLVFESSQIVEGDSSLYLNTWSVAPGSESGPCAVDGEGLDAAGKDLVLQTWLDAGDVLDASLLTALGNSLSWDGVLWLMDSCAQPTCVVAADAYGPEHEEQVVYTAATDGDVFLVVDGAEASSEGMFQLTIYVSRAAGRSMPR